MERERGKTECVGQIVTVVVHDLISDPSFSKRILEKKRKQCVDFAQGHKLHMISPPLTLVYMLTE